MIETSRRPHSGRALFVYLIAFATFLLAPRALSQTDEQAALARELGAQIQRLDGELDGAARRIDAAELELANVRRTLAALVESLDDDGGDPPPVDDSITDETLEAIARATSREGFLVEKYDAWILETFSVSSREDLTEEEGQQALAVALSDEFIDTGGGTGPPPGSGKGNLVRLFSAPPAGVFAIRFAGSAPFEGLRSEPIAWGPSGSPTAWLTEALVDPAVLPEGELEDLVVPVELLSPAWPAPDRMPRVDVLVKASGREPVGGSLESGAPVVLEGLRIAAWERLWRPGIYEVELLLQSSADRYYDSVGVMIPGDSSIYAPGLEDQSSSVLVSDVDAGGVPFIWLGGSATIRRYLVGVGITETDRARFRAWQHVAKLTGPQSYEAGGWGVTSARYPRLAPELVGWDVAGDRHYDALSLAEQVEAHVRDHQPSAQFKYADGLGPWHPRGERSGAGSGGVEIHPYGGWAMTAGEAYSAWWQLRTMLERMPFGYYSGGLPASKPEWARPYEAELIKYQPHDTAHNQRAMLPATVAAWNTGSPAAAEWLRQLPGRYESPSNYPAEFNGRGHKYAHRAEGWAATRIANAFALSPPGSPTRGATRELAEAQRAKMLAVAMPSGIMHRSGDIHAGGPYAANLNPNLWQFGKLPEGTTVARQIMTAIIGNGAMALEVGVFDDGATFPLISSAADAAYFVPKANGNGYVNPPAGQLIVGGLELDEVLETPYYGPKDDSVNVWENQWHLVDAYRVSGDVRYLRRAIEIMGWGEAPFENVGRLEYARTGSNRAWWSYTPEVVAEAQALAAQD